METLESTARRTESLSVLLTEDEKKSYEKMCKARGCTQQGYLRRYIESELINYELDKLEGV